MQVKTVDPLHGSPISFHLFLLSLLHLTLSLLSCVAQWSRKLVGCVPVCRPELKAAHEPLVHVDENEDMLALNVALVHSELSEVVTLLKELQLHHPCSLVNTDKLYSLQTSNDEELFYRVVFFYRLFFFCFSFSRGIILQHI